MQVQRYRYPTNEHKWNVCGVAMALDLHKRHGIHGYDKVQQWWKVTFLYRASDMDILHRAVYR